MRFALWGAPTTKVPPLMPIELPNASPAAPPTAPSVAVGDPFPPTANTNAAPAPFAYPLAPTTAVVPLMATEVPKFESAAPPGGRNSCCADQVPPEEANTYAEPTPTLPDRA